VIERPVRDGPAFFFLDRETSNFPAELQRTAWRREGGARSPECLTTTAPDVIKLIFVNLAAESIAVDSKFLGGVAAIAPRAFQNTLDELFFEFRHSFFEQDSAFDHHVD
jgi:hypothetical protein